MPMLERTARRTAHTIVYEDSLNPLKRRLVSSLLPFHYQDENGAYQLIDMAPVRVEAGAWTAYPTFAGWRVTTNGWHFALAENGQVGFGGRQGAHWFWFRLRHVGYLDDPASSPDLGQDWHHISAAQPTPTYDTAQLSRSTQQRAVEGQAYVSRVLVEWRNLWTTPGGGELYLRFVADGQRLKAEYVINQAGRDWIAANASPADKGIAAATAYFSFAFQLDWSDIPRRVVDGVLQSGDADFEDSAASHRGRGVELQNALGELLAFMPIDDVYVEEQIDTGRVDNGGDPIYETRRRGVRLRKRFWKDADGNHYLVVGAKAGDINALPAGDLVFDPTLTPSVGASSDDAEKDSTYYETATTMQVGGVGTSPASDYGQGWRFTNIGLSGGDTVDSAYLTLVEAADAWINHEHRFTCADEDNAATFSSGSPPGSRAIVSTIVDFSHNESRSDGTAYDFPINSTDQASFAGAIQDVIDRTGWANGNALAVINNSDQDASAYENFGRSAYASYDHATYDAPQLTIDYTAGSGGSGDPNSLPQSWYDSADDVQIRFTADGRVQVGDESLMATDDALIEAHREETETGKPERGLHLLGEITGTLDSIVSWIVQELVLKGTGGISALHSALRVRLTNENTGTMGAGADLRAADVEVINDGGSNGNNVPDLTGLRVGVTNQADGYADTAYGIKVEVNDAGSLDQIYAFHADAGLLHVADALEVPVLNSDPSETPPTDYVLVYVKLDSGVPRWYSKDDSDTVRAM